MKEERKKGNYSGKTKSLMNRKREIVVLVLCLIAEIGLAFQLKEPYHFTSTSLVIEGVKDNNWWIITRSLVAMNMIGLALFAISVWKGNRKGKLHISYFVMLIQAAAMFLLPTATGYVSIIMDSELLKFNVGIHMLTLILIVLILALFILREKGAIRVMPKLSSVMLLAVLGEFIVNGIFSSSVVTEPTLNMVIYGIISALPYLTIFVFEFFILEPTMRRYR